MISPVNVSTQQIQQNYNNPYSTRAAKQYAISADQKNIDKKSKTFSGHFKENTKRLIPLGAVLTGLWTVIDMAKAKKTLSKSIISNVCCITPVILAVSVVKSYFQSGSGSKK